MSDNWIALIPEDPRFVPDAAQRQRARDLFAEIAPDAEMNPNIGELGEKYQREFEKILATKLRVIYLRV